MTSVYELMGKVSEGCKEENQIKEKVENMFKVKRNGGKVEQASPNVGAMRNKPNIMRWKEKMRKWKQFSLFHISLCSLLFNWTQNIMLQVYLRRVETVEGWKSLFAFIRSWDVFLVLYSKHFCFILEIIMRDASNLTLSSLLWVSSILYCEFCWAFLLDLKMFVIS